MVKNNSGFLVRRSL